jgi:hypothetical protein
MKRVLTVAAVIAIAIPAFASSELTVGRVNGVNQAHYSIDGKLSPMGERQTTTSMWDFTTNSNYYWGAMASDTLPLDWGDIDDGSVVEGLAFAYAVPSTLQTPETVNCTIVFYSDYNGFNNNGFYGTFGFAYSNLPTTFGTGNGWIITGDLEPNFTFAITGNDLDADGKADFGYSYWFPDRFGQGLAIGPFLCNYDTTLYPRDPNGGTIYSPDTAVWAALGAEDAFDRFTDPNTGTYLGTSFFGGWTPGDPNTVYSQFYMNLFGDGGPIPCPTAGASGNFCTADIDGSADCIVGLPDLAALLSAYGVNAGGDIEPPGGDGDTDLQDLAALLAQYGDDCN